VRSQGNLSSPRNSLSDGALGAPDKASICPHKLGEQSRKGVRVGQELLIEPLKNLRIGIEFFENLLPRETLSRWSSVRKKGEGAFDDCSGAGCPNATQCVRNSGGMIRMGVEKVLVEAAVVNVGFKTPDENEGLLRWRKLRKLAIAQRQEDIADSKVQVFVGARHSVRLTYRCCAAAAFRNRGLHQGAMNEPVVHHHRKRGRTTQVTTRCSRQLQQLGRLARGADLVRHRSQLGHHKRLCSRAHSGETTS
jgi:hypothetical protein